MLVSRSLRRSLWTCAAPLLILGVRVPECPAQTLQESIDNASPGDTVQVPPGDYTKRVRMHKDITLMATDPGSARLVGLEGSLGTASGLVFDGSLSAGPVELVLAETGLALEGCSFMSAVRGVRVLENAQAVRISDCRFAELLQAVRFEPGVRDLAVTDSEITDTTQGIIGPGVFSCQPTPGREPADRCAGTDCGSITVQNVTMAGGSHGVVAAGDFLLRIADSRLTATSVAGGAGGRSPPGAHRHRDRLRRPAGNRPDRGDGLRVRGTVPDHRLEHCDPGFPTEAAPGTAMSVSGPEPRRTPTT